MRLGLGKPTDVVNISKIVIKAKRDNLKKEARKRSQQIRMNNLKTVGGKAEFIPPDEILEKVTGFLGSTCTGFEVLFGGDGTNGGGGSDTLFDFEVLEDSGDVTESQKQGTLNFARPKVDKMYLPSTSEGAKRKAVMSNPFQRKGGIRKEVHTLLTTYYEKMAQR